MVCMLDLNSLEHAACSILQNYGMHQVIKITDMRMKELNNKVVVVKR